MTLRAAARGDEAKLLEWRNDPDVRASAFDESVVSPDRHHEWFENKLADPRCRIYIVEDEGQALGQARLDAVSADEAEVDIALARDARGRGLGAEALRSLAAIAAAELGVGRLRARVKAGNVASQRAFTAAGFAEAGRGEDVVEFVRNVDDA